MINEKHISLLSAAGLVLVGILVLAWWFSYDPTREFIEHGPGMDNQDASKRGTWSVVNIGQDYTRFDSLTTEISGFWPRFRGPFYDNISRESILLQSDWSTPPDILWRVSLGEGHAAPAVAKGRIYLLDYLEDEKADALRCFSLEDGRELWRRWYPVRVKRNHGMSRTIPAVSDSFVVTIGPRCHVMCVHSEHGELFWGIDLEQEFGTEVPFWYTGQCPLIDENTAILAPGGRALMIGVDCSTGEIRWETPNPDTWKMSHSSIIPMTLHNKKMYVYCMTEGVIGVSADSVDLGRLLWKSTAWSHSVIAPSPLYLGDNRILLTAGYGSGSMIIQINQTDSIYSVEVIQECKPDEGFASEQQTPILFDGHLFGVLPKDAGGLRNQFVCVDPNDLTKIIWSSGKTHRFGLGPYVLVNNQILLLNDDGHLHLLNASTQNYQPVTSAQILDGHDAWGPMAVVDGRLLLRDSGEMVCIHIGDRN
ncbi:PQQ-binding-like beta-propeller repeat protein [candidate division KSB1 bacterium]|nr:PQQ-binding-like beta-propeller repeat protein [candidate division KSB1 bacterium]